MTTTPQARVRLDELGDALRAAALADVARVARRRRRRTVAGVMATTAIVLPGAALATSALLSGDDVARSIPSGTWALMGTDPHCTTVRANVEFDCTLASAPKEGDVPAGAWKGTVEPTVDRSKHVNGGCRSLDAAGTHWRCYLGDEAVRQQIIGASLLGQRSAGPSRG
jgi:hypothetical protein